MIQEYGPTNLNIFKISKKQKIYKLFFYILVCLPSLAYFTGIIFGGLILNKQIVKNIKLTS
jgi:hypothetical protein